MKKVSQLSQIHITTAMKSQQVLTPKSSNMDKIARLRYISLSQVFDLRDHYRKSAFVKSLIFVSALKMEFQLSCTRPVTKDKEKQRGDTFKKLQPEKS